MGKNSWGNSWGQGGFGKVARGENMCSIEDWVNYPMIDKADAMRVSAVRSLAELGDEQGTEWSNSADDDDADDDQAYQYNSNDGYETPWNAQKLEESNDLSKP